MEGHPYPTADVFSSNVHPMIHLPAWLNDFILSELLYFPCVSLRGGMIQTCEQYQFVHHVLSLYEKLMSHTAEE